MISAVWKFDLSVSNRSARCRQRFRKESEIGDVDLTILKNNPIRDIIVVEYDEDLFEDYAQNGGHHALDERRVELPGKHYSFLCVTCS